MGTDTVFKHLLVPLDGSHLAETALPAAAFLAGKFHSRLTLIHLIEHNAPPEVHSDRHLTEAREAQAYLDEVAQRAMPAGTPVERHVHTTEVNNVARSLVAHASELEVGLIVMCTHGRGGLRDWLFGSIAQQVAGQGDTPVLMIRPTETGEAPPFACRLILVPLDGDPAHEQSLPVAGTLARTCGGSLRLVTVIRSEGGLKGEQAAAALLMPLTTKALVELDEQQAESYLAAHVARLRTKGVAASAEVGRGDPVPYVRAAAQRSGADLVVLGTHGRLGLEATWAGSVGPKISGRSPAPLLLVPFAETKA